MDSVSNSSEIEPVIARIDAALLRIRAAGEKLEATPSNGEDASPSSAKVMSLVNRHETMREELAITLRDLDTIIGKLEI